MSNSKLNSGLHHREAEFAGFAASITTPRTGHNSSSPGQRPGYTRTETSSPCKGKINLRSGIALIVCVVVGSIGCGVASSGNAESEPTIASKQAVGSKSIDPNSPESALNSFKEIVSSVTALSDFRSGKFETSTAPTEFGKKFAQDEADRLQKLKEKLQQERVARAMSDEDIKSRKESSTKLEEILSRSKYLSEFDKKYSRQLINEAERDIAAKIRGADVVSRLEEEVAEIESRISQAADRARRIENGEKWVKWFYWTGNISYNVETTTSLVSPFVAEMTFDMWDARQGMLTEDKVDAFTVDKCETTTKYECKVAYAFQEGTWAYKSLLVKDPETKKWEPKGWIVTEHQDLARALKIQ